MVLPLEVDAGVLSQRALRGLKSYQYKAGGYTWLDDAHQPLWNYCVARLPMWLAPNLITLTGTLGIVLAYALNIYYNPSFTGEAPTWVYLVTALSVALYVNLDCMDGKQARRTGSSSPLGQLFDHGCDALALHMMLGNIASSLGVGCGWKMAAGCLGIMVPWMLAQWEELHTGVMMYGNACYGVLEANYSICAVHLLSAALGLRFWRAELTLPAWMGLGGQGAAGAATTTTTVAEVALVVVGLAGVLQGVSNVARVFSAPPLPPQEAGHKQLGKRWALLHLLGLLATMGLGAASVALSPCTAPNSSSSSSSSASASFSPASNSSPLSSSVLGAASGMFSSSGAPSPPPAPVSGHASETGHGGDGDAQGLLAAWTTDAVLCRSSFSTFGVLYALAATQLIVAHMAKEPWSPSVVALALPALHVASVAAGWQGVARLVLTMHVLALAVYANYVGNIISQICAHLGVKCLTITPKPPAPPPQQQQQPHQLQQ